MPSVTLTLPHNLPKPSKYHFLNSACDDIVGDQNAYVYWNYHKKVFSLRFRGKVLGHFEAAVAYDSSFVVSRKGYERSVREGKKCVHAFIVSSVIRFGNTVVNDEITRVNSTRGKDLGLIKYNYKYSNSFKDADDKEITFSPITILIAGPKSPGVYTVRDINA